MRISAVFTSSVAAVLAAILPVGCQTTEQVTNQIEMEFPEGTSSTLLDSRLKRLTEMAAEYPKRSDLHFQIAAIHFQKEEFRKSAQSLNRAIYLDSQNAKYHYQLGRVHLRMGELEAAETAFREAVSLSRENRFTGLYFALGYTLALLRNYDEAAKQFEICIEIDRNNPDPYYYLGSIADIQADSARAIRFMREYIDRGGQTFRRRAVQVLSYHGVVVEEPKTPEAFDLPPAAEPGFGSDLPDTAGSKPFGSGSRTSGGS